MIKQIAIESGTEDDLGSVVALTDTNELYRLPLYASQKDIEERSGWYQLPPIPKSLKRKASVSPSGRPNLPEKYMKEGTARAQGGSVFGIPLDVLDRDELLAVVGHLATENRRLLESKLDSVSLMKEMALQRLDVRIP